MNHEFSDASGGETHLGPFDRKKPPKNERKLENETSENTTLDSTSEKQKVVVYYSNGASSATAAYASLMSNVNKFQLICLLVPRKRR